jgi:hypothetical protein
MQAQRLVRRFTRAMVVIRTSIREPRRRVARYRHIARVFSAKLMTMMVTPTIRLAAATGHV